MARNTIGSRRGSVRGAPPGVYVPFGTYDPFDHNIRASIKFFADWLKIAVILFLVIAGCFLYVLFTDGE